MPDQRLRIVVATPLRQELCDRIAAVDPDRVEVVVDQTLLPPMRHPADHQGDPQWTRTAQQQQQWEALLAGADVLYGIPGMSAAQLQDVVRSNPRLRWVQTMAAGGGATVVEADLPTEALQRITFTTSAGVHGSPLAEFALLGIFAGAKDLPRLQRQQREHDWPGRIPTRPIEGSTVLIIGLGGIGRALASRCAALGMRVLGARRQAEPVDGVEVYRTDELPEVIGQADHIVVTLPGTPHTNGLVGRELLAAARRGVTVVNVGRGTVIDEPALIDALRCGQVGFAALDVFNAEPLDPASPLWDMDNVLVSPHSAALDVREEERIAELFIRNLRRFLAGEPMHHAVDPTQGY